MLVGNKLTEDNKIISIRDWEKDAKYKEVCMREGLQYWNFLSAVDLHEKKEFKEADIIHFHNLHGDYFNYLSLPCLTRLKPSVWTLHDMQSFTGHCAFSYGCEKWKTGCGDGSFSSSQEKLGSQKTQCSSREKSLFDIGFRRQQKSAEGR